MMGRHYESGFEIWRDTGDTDDWGTTIENFEMQAEMEGRLRPLSGDMRMAADKQTEFATHKLYCDPVDIRAGDRIHFQGDVFRVNFAQDVMSMDRLMQVELELLPDQ